MKYIAFLILPLFSCTAQVEESENDELTSGTKNIDTLNNPDSLEIIDFYKMYSNIEGQSESIGSVSKGELKNGKIIPFYGANYKYFDRDSYLASRAFTSDVVKEIILDTYKTLHTEYPQRKFFLMELSNQEGGKIYPHRTHQNGLSADFMMPKIKKGEPDYSLDTLGKRHYFLDFNDDGEYVKDTSVRIDFDLIAKHILLLNETASKHDYSIEKVIIKIEYKDNLFNTPNGKKLQKSGIYVVKNLSPLINSIHDDHYHIDFKKNR